jgi:hypothetical protein
MKIRAVTLSAAMLASAAPSGAKTVCGQLGDPDGRFYVIFKVKTKVGTIAPVHGYFITQAGVGTPFSGHYSVGNADRITLTTSDGSEPTGFGPATNLRNWEAPSHAAGGDGNHYGTLVNEGTTSTIPSTSTSFEDCRNVPKFGLDN